MGNPKKHKYVVREYRTPSKPFNKNNERELLRAAFHDILFRTRKIARTATARSSGSTTIRLAGHVDEHARRVVEIKVFDDDYSTE